MERETGIEPATSSLGSWRSTAELLPLAYKAAETSYKALIINTLQWMKPAQSVCAIPYFSRLSQASTDTMDTTKSRCPVARTESCEGIDQRLSDDDARDNLHKLASNDDEPETASSTGGKSAVTEVRTRWPPQVRLNDETNAGFVPECS